ILRLTVTDTVGTTAVVKSTFTIDRLLMSGWPQATNVRFPSPPAVADLDPAFPGLEIAAIGEDQMLYVWHKDGTSAPGWPLKVLRSIYSAQFQTPAVGDLDGDGTLEI